jgi:hypothetical protein
MLKTYCINTFPSRKYPISNYAYKFRGFIYTKYIRPYLGNGPLTSQVYASSAVLQINKDVNKV